MTTEKQKLIDKYIGRIKIDYPEDDKLMIDLQQFADEIVKLLDLHNVVKSLSDLDGLTIPVTFSVKKYQPRIIIDDV